MEGGAPSSEERGAERLMDAYLESIGLVRKRIAKDGSCLFRAVAEQVLHCQTLHTAVRSQCVDFLKQNRDAYEAFVEGDFDEHLLKLQDPQQWVGEVEINALAVIFKRDFLIFQEPGKPAVNITDKKFDKKVRLCFLNGNHYDSVYPASHFKSAALCQSIVYELLYDSVFGVERGALGMCQRTRRPSDFLCDDSMAACVSSDESDVDASEPPSVENGTSAAPGRNHPSSRGRGRGRQLPERVRRSLNPTLLRNVEYDVWSKSKRAQQKMDYCIAAGMQLTVGDRCQVRLENGRSYNATVNSAPSGGHVTVHLEDQGTKKVPLSWLRPPGAGSSWSTVAAKKLSNGHPEWGKSRGKSVSSPAAVAPTTSAAPGSAGRLQKQHSRPGAAPEEQSKSSRKSQSAVEVAFGLTEEQRLAREEEERNVALVEIQMRDELSFPALGKQPGTPSDGGKRKGGEKKSSVGPKTVRSFSSVQAFAAGLQRSPVEDSSSPTAEEQPAPPPSAPPPSAPPSSALPSPAPPSAPPSSTSPPPEAPLPAVSSLPLKAPLAPPSSSSAPQTQSYAAAAAAPASPPPSPLPPLLPPSANVSFLTPALPPAAPPPAPAASPPTFIAPIAPSPTGFLRHSPSPPSSSSSSLIRPVAPEGQSQNKSVSRDPRTPKTQVPAPALQKQDLQSPAVQNQDLKPPEAQPCPTTETPETDCGQDTSPATLDQVQVPGPVAVPAPQNQVPGPAPENQDLVPPEAPIQGQSPGPAEPPPASVQPPPPSRVPHPSPTLSAPKPQTQTEAPPTPSPCQPSHPPPPSPPPPPPQQLQQQLSQLRQDLLYPGFPQGDAGSIAPPPPFSSNKCGDDLPRDVNILRFFFNLGVKAYSMPFYPPCIYLLPLQQAHMMQPKPPSRSPSPRCPPAAPPSMQQAPPPPHPSTPPRYEHQAPPAEPSFPPPAPHGMPCSSLPWQQAPPSRSPVYPVGYPQAPAPHPLPPLSSQGYQPPRVPGQPLYHGAPPPPYPPSSLPYPPPSVPEEVQGLVEQLQDPSFPGRGLLQTPPALEVHRAAADATSRALMAPSGFAAGREMRDGANRALLLLDPPLDHRAVVSLMSEVPPKDVPGHFTPSPYHSPRQPAALAPPYLPPGALHQSVGCHPEEAWEEADGLRQTTVNHRGTRRGYRGGGGWRGRGGPRRRPAGDMGAGLSYMQFNPSHRGWSHERGY